MQKRDRQLTAAVADLQHFVNHAGSGAEAVHEGPLVAVFGVHDVHEQRVHGLGVAGGLCTAPLQRDHEVLAAVSAHVSGSYASDHAGTKLLP